MKQLYTFLAICFISLPTLVRGQACTPNPGFTGEGISPDTLQNMAPACVGVPYSQTFTIHPPPDTTISGFVFTVNFLQITGVTGLPAGFNYACAPANCTYPGGTIGCAIVTGTATAGQAGTYPITIAATFQIFNVIFGTQTVTYNFNGYELVINPNPTVSITPGGSIIACAPGSVTLDAGSFSSYQWFSNGVILPADTNQTYAPVTSNTYSVEVTNANGCSARDTVVFSISPGISITPGTIDATCGQNDGEAWVACGGFAPFTFSWNTVPVSTNDTITGQGAGAYTVVVTDSLGCVDSLVIAINNQGGPVLDTMNTVNVSCFGGNDGSATIVHSGGMAPYDYVWSSGGLNSTENGLTAGTYTVTVSDGNNCLLVGTATITEPAELLLAPSATDETCPGCNDGTANVVPSGGTGSTTYAWSNGATTQQITGLAGGQYCVTVTDANGCQKDTCVTVGTIISNLDAMEGGMLVYPNPAKENVRVILPAGWVCNVELINLQGQVVMMKENSKAEISLPLGELPGGVYLLRATSGEKMVRELIVKE